MTMEYNKPERSVILCFDSDIGVHLHKVHTEQMTHSALIKPEEFLAWSRQLSIFSAYASD